MCKVDRSYCCRMDVKVCAIAVHELLRFVEQVSSDVKNLFILLSVFQSGIGSRSCVNDVDCDGRKFNGHSH